MLWFCPWMLRTFSREKNCCFLDFVQMRGWEGPVHWNGSFQIPQLCLSLYMLPKSKNIMKVFNWSNHFISVQICHILRGWNEQFLIELRQERGRVELLWQCHPGIVVQLFTKRVGIFTRQGHITPQVSKTTVTESLIGVDNMIGLRSNKNENVLGL